MRLNPDCVRDILLTIEENSDFNHQTEFHKNSSAFPRLSGYSHDELTYHIRQCEKAGLVFGVEYYGQGPDIDIADLAPSGHEFLANVRSDNIWNKTKSVAEKVGSFSLDVLCKIATGVLTKIISSSF